MADLNYWAGDPFDEQLNQLKSALTTNEALVTLTGEAQVGKSALCQEFQAITQANGDFVIYLANPPTTSKDLQQEFKSRQPRLDQYSFMTVLEQWLVERSQQGQKTVLIIDNAHQLNVEVCTTIRLISNLQTETRHLIQVLLCARPQMYKVLGQPEYGGLLQRVSHRLELLPLNKTQLHQLVNDCYSVHLAPATLSLMYKLSQGKPGIAVNMAQMLGQQGSTGQSSTGELSKRQFGRAISHNTQFGRLLTRHRLSQSILPASVLTAALISLFLYIIPVRPT
ncbi:MAG: ATP-binding protein, partial [Psychrosphaera sp.]|nr:ATP-binding protein [Psychrosphaera sp.]